MSEVKKPKILDTNDLLPPKGEVLVRVHVKKEYGKILSLIFKLFPRLKKKLPDIVKEMDVSFIPSEVLITVLTRVKEFTKLEQATTGDPDETIEEIEKVLRELAGIIQLIFDANEDNEKVSVNWVLRNLNPQQMAGVLTYAVDAFRKTAEKNGVAAQALGKVINL